MYGVQTAIFPDSEQHQKLSLSLRSVRFITAWTVQYLAQADESSPPLAKAITALKREPRNKWLTIPDSQSLWIAASNVKRALASGTEPEEIMQWRPLIRLKQTMYTPAIGKVVLGKLGEHACDLRSLIPDQDRIKRITIGFKDNQWRAALHIQPGASLPTNEHDIRKWSERADPVEALRVLRECNRLVIERLNSLHGAQTAPRHQQRRQHA